LIENSCTDIFVLVDLNTQLDNQTKFNCPILLRDWYKGKVNLKNFKDKFNNLKVIVIAQEIESWLYSA
jgi:hypothetical protein